MKPIAISTANPRFKRLILLLLVQILIIFVLHIFIPALFITDRIDQLSTTGQRLFPLEKGISYSQTISNPNRSINSVSLELKNPMIKNQSEILIDIIDSSQNQLSQFVFNGSNIGDPSWLTLNFKPIALNPIIIRISSDNHDSDSLYLVGTSETNLNFQTSYYTGTFKDRFYQRINHVLALIFQSHALYNYVYFAVILIINIMILF